MLVFFFLNIGEGGSGGSNWEENIKQLKIDVYGFHGLQFERHY